MEETVEREVADLRRDYEVDVIESDSNASDWPDNISCRVVIQDWSLPDQVQDNYSHDRTDVMIEVPERYPNQPPDWIFVRGDLTLADGSAMRRSKPNYRDNWLSLSYHANKLDDVHWIPGDTGLRWYLEEFTSLRFTQQE
jgi:hypothetical protein